MKKLRMPVILLALLGLTTLASAQIKVENVWVRATVPNQHSTGAFMKITSGESVRLVAVTSAAAGINEIHEMRMDGNVMTMRALPTGLEIPARKTVELKSGGYHLMMMDLQQTIKAGDVVPLQLQFDDAKGRKQMIAVSARASFKDPYAP